MAFNSYNCPDAVGRLLSILSTLPMTLAYSYGDPGIKLSLALSASQSRHLFPKLGKVTFFGS